MSRSRARSPRGRAEPGRDPFDAVVERLVYGGHGLCRLAGEVVLVEGAVAPGERVRLRDTGRRAGVRWASLLEVLEPSPLRVEPGCSRAERCGGCQLRHVRPGEQAALKTAMALEVLTRQRVDLTHCTVREAPACPTPDGWRSRVRYHGRLIGPAGGVRFGFLGRRSGELVPLDHCPQAHPAAELLRPELEKLLSGRGWPVEELLIEAPAAEALHVTLTGPSRPAAAGTILDELARGLPRVRGWRYVTPAGVVARGDELLRFPLGGAEEREPRRLELRSGSFFQANLDGNRRLIAAVRELTRPASGTRVLELFCGSGNLTVPLAEAGARVLALEGEAAAVRSCQENARRLGLPGIEAREWDLGRGLPDRLDLPPHPVVVLDPPRSGAAGLMEPIAALDPARIVYVACGPPALARDLGELARHGYRPTELRALDLFPQTYHLELVVLLERVGTD